MFDLEGKRVYVAGHRGMVGSALVRRLSSEPVTLITATRAEVDLRDQAAVRAFVADQKPDVMIVAAAKVGGILANKENPADFLFDNLAIETNLIEAADRSGVAKLLFLGSSCIYPRDAPQPISEDALLTGPLESTNQWYAIAKIAGIKLAEAYRSQHGRDFISGMPTNLYGPGDNFDLMSSHVVPALMRKAHEAKLANSDTLTIWGSGTPRREFLHVDDCADACITLLTRYSGAQHLNIGAGEDISIHDLAVMICEIVGFEGRIETDPSKPDGTPRKLMDSSRLRALGWEPRINLRDGLAETYRWFSAHYDGASQPAPTKG